jgi:condensin-2 complex subunit H2
LDELTFEHLCRAHINAFAKGAEKFKAETHLSKRVDDWQSRLAPILEEEEERPEFNIRVYGERILSALQDDQASRKKEQTNFGSDDNENDDTSNNSKKEDKKTRRTTNKESNSDDSATSKSLLENDKNLSHFKVVTENCDKYEVCRLFLSSLMLCNSGNVTLRHEEDGKISTTETLQMELLHNNYAKPTDTFQQQAQEPP